MCKFVAGSGRLPAHIINATQPLRYRTNTQARSPTCMHAAAITLAPRTRKQAHMVTMTESAFVLALARSCRSLTTGFIPRS